MTLPQPVPLGLRKSFGFGDRLGLATPGHLAAVKKTNFAPVLAQQSVREMERTGRTPAQVLDSAQQAIVEQGYGLPWGADADHHKTPEDLDKAVAAGFSLFTLDPSDLLFNDADRLPAADIDAHLRTLEAEGAFPDPDWQRQYLRHHIPLSPTMGMNFTQPLLSRIAVKYGRALAAAERLAKHLRKICGERPGEIEVSIDETASPTTPHEHLFFAMELKRRGVQVVSLAPRFVGDFEKGIDYRGDPKKFESNLRDHVQIARFCGPYKISVHSGSDKFSLYPIIGRVCGELLHLKTAGTSYLEALRAIARRAPQLFAEIAEFSRTRFEADRKTYALSTSLKELNALPAFTGPKDEALFLDQRPGRQLLHVTFGSVLRSGADKTGRPFKDALLEQLMKHQDLHLELIEKHFDRHLTLLNAG